MEELPVSATLRERVRCPVCDAPARKPFYSKSYDADPVRGFLHRYYEGRLDEAALSGHCFELCRCCECGLVFQRWVPNESFLAYLYGYVAKAKPTEIASQRDLSVRLRYQHDIERVVRYVGGESPPRVLDFGAGTGLWLEMAAAHGCRTAACELDASVAARLGRLGHETVLLDGLGDERFDFINTEQVFEHLTEPRRVLAALVKGLSIGGLLRLSVPNGGDLDARLRSEDWMAPKGTARSLDCVAPLEHLNCFDHDSLVRLAAEFGLTPFVFPLRVEVHQLARMRYAASALVHLVRPPAGTMLYFARSE